MQDGYPDTITIVERQMQDVKSTGADIHCFVSVTGAMTGTPPEVAKLRDALVAEACFPRDCIHVESTSRPSEGWLPAGCTFVILACLGIVFSPTQKFEMAYATPIVVAAAAVVGLLVWWANRATNCTFRVQCATSAAVEQAQILIGKAKKVDMRSTDWRYEIDRKN